MAVLDSAGTAATALAAAEMERVDRIMASVAVRVEETVEVIQGALVGPLKQGAAIVTAVRAALSLLRDWQRRPRHAREDHDEAMFVG